MSQFFHEIGLQSPAQVGVANGGAEPEKEVYILNASGKNYTVGQVVLLDGSSGASDTLSTKGEVDITQFVDVLGSLATGAGPAVVGGQMYGLLLEDIDNGTRGRVMLRGVALGSCQSVTASITNTTAALLTCVDLIGADGNLVPCIDIDAADYCKPLALYRGATNVSTSTALRPVIFNGVEGIAVTAVP